jgi:hypothetical protein
MEALKEFAAHVTKVDHKYFVDESTDHYSEEDLPVNWFVHEEGSALECEDCHKLIYSGCGDPEAKLEDMDFHVGDQVELDGQVLFVIDQRPEHDEYRLYTEPNPIVETIICSCGFTHPMGEKEYEGFQEGSYSPDGGYAHKYSERFHWEEGGHSWYIQTSGIRGWKYAHGPELKPVAVQTSLDCALSIHILSNY